MHNTRRELLDDFLLFVSDKDDAEARVIAEGCLNRALMTIWMKLPWRAFRSSSPYELTLVPGQSRYALPDYFGRIGPGEVRNATRGGVINRLDDGQLEADFPQSGTSLEQPGLVARYEIVGSCGVHTQPLVTGEILEALSTSLEDVDVVVGVSGDDENGNWTRAEVTLTGTHPVSLGRWTFVDEFGKSFPLGTPAPVELATSRGNVILRKTVDQSEIQQLFPHESARQHDIFKVYPKPLSPDVLLLPVIRKPKRVFADADALPDLWAPALFEGMLIDWQVNAGEMTTAAGLEAQRPALVDLVAFENQQRGTVHKRAFGMGRR